MSSRSLSPHRHPSHPYNYPSLSHSLSHLPFADPAIIMSFAVISPIAADMTERGRIAEEEHEEEEEALVSFSLISFFSLSYEMKSSSLSFVF